MIEHLYLVVEPTKRGWRRVRISKVSKHKPRLPRPSEQALVRLDIDLPSDVLQPRILKVEIRPEHLAQPTITVNPSQP